MARAIRRGSGGIRLYRRIGAVADVFDAPGSRPSYKEPWPLEQILDHLREQRGMHFDPVIVDWVLAHVDAMVAVAQGFPDARH
jgi:response regulator RpfG family c-di-GMP phosphodiesterase